MPRVLFVDDNRDFLEIAALALKKAGYDVTTAEDGSEAINKYNESPFDAVVTDVMIPNLNGHELARHIRNTANGSPPVIIGITGTSYEIDLNCFDVVLHKPFYLKKLIECLKDYPKNKVKS